MKITKGGLLGACYGACMSIGLWIVFDSNWQAGMFIGMACGGLGSMIGDIWGDMLVRQRAREEQETEELGRLLAEETRKR